MNKDNKKLGMGLGALLNNNSQNKNNINKRENITKKGTNKKNAHRGRGRFLIGCRIGHFWLAPMLLSSWPSTPLALGILGGLRRGVEDAPQVV